MNNYILHPHVYLYVGEDRPSLRSGEYVFVTKASVGLHWWDNEPSSKYLRDEQMEVYLRIWRKNTWTEHPVKLSMNRSALTRVGVETELFLPTGWQKPFVRMKKAPTKTFYRVYSILAAGPLSAVEVYVLENGRWGYTKEVSMGKHEFVNLAALTDKQQSLAFIAGLYD
jgi:hypothetical protein